ncbi:UDP-glucose 4-epimerase/UDP-arabinose 4-epimerase [Brevundimonas alba]|uniref:UDP-glucose 4-epimerase n=1 Tax=Brevundimonas alba TaxID=74314 RepID=A0A7X5YHL8_9CAUL|nr:UDP-glucose 4-epimerase GalE [Brevundimonas alba]NJC39854.1 UDP-glucose 4-epimerase/UDP-arabinose 4-epimerase [Brevundimonas alba]
MSDARRVLVTGGAGYIGSHTAKALAKAGHLPVAFDDLSNGHTEAVRWGPLVIGDVRDPAAVEACMREHRIDSVIHFAGLIEVGRSVVEPDIFWDVNLNGVASVLNAMRACNVDRLVFSSTAAVYGQPDVASLDPLAETLPTQPINPYGDSKLAAERLIAAHARAFGVKGIALRYFNACGADPDGEIGEAHQPESHLIPLAIEAALGLGPALTVFGQDFPTPDGSCIRDYIHVADLADAHVRALGADVGDEGFAAMNLGVGRGRSVLEVIEAVSAAVGHATPYSVGPRRPGDPACLVANPERAQARLGWTPRYTDLEEIVATAVAWRRAPAFGPRLLDSPKEVA